MEVEVNGVTYRRKELDRSKIKELCEGCVAAGNILCANMPDCATWVDGEPVIYVWEEA